MIGSILERSDEREILASAVRQFDLDQYALQIVRLQLQVRTLTTEVDALKSVLSR